MRNIMTKPNDSIIIFVIKTSASLYQTLSQMIICVDYFMHVDFFAAFWHVKELFEMLSSLVIVSMRQTMF